MVINIAWKQSNIWKRYADDPRVKYIKHKINQSGSAARNTGIQNSVGEYIAFLDDDDYFFKDRVKGSHTFLAEFKCGLWWCLL
ncbi:glycosyltransferase [Bacteroides fragilis]|nr:glycosyltransferase [Bacteroides fragilis]